MSTYFTEPRHDDLRASVRAFAEGEVRPLLPELEATRTVNHDLSRRIAQQGLLGVTIDEEHGGMGAGHLAKTIIIEELSRVCGAMGAMVQASQLGVAKIIHFGDDAQRKTWLPKVASGEVLPTIAVTDPASGGHVLGMQGTAVRDGNDYLLNGRKVFVGNSHVGDLHGVVLRTGEGSRADCPLERYLRDAFHIFAPAGTSDVQWLRLGEVALGTVKGSWSEQFAEWPV